MTPSAVADGYSPIMSDVAYDYTHPAADVVYDYTSADGTLAYQVIRTGNGRGKTFRIIDADGTPLPDPIPEHRALLYRLPDLADSQPATTVYVVEGEKDADTLARLGLTATTNPCGSRMGWRHRYTPWLAGRHVVLLPDADGPGRRHMQAVHAALVPAAASVVTVRLAEHGPWDVTDWLTHGHRNLEKLTQRVRRARLEHAGINRNWPNRVDRDALVWSAQLPSTQKLVLACLASMWQRSSEHPRERGQVPAAALVGRRCGLHRVTAQNTLSALRGAGVVAVDGRGGRIVWDVLAVLSERT